MSHRRYLDCGCCIEEDGQRTWCPTCASDTKPAPDPKLAEIDQLKRQVLELKTAGARLIQSLKWEVVRSGITYHGYEDMKAAIASTPIPVVDDVRALRLACEALVRTIKSTGGILHHPDGTCAPKADPDWIDLGDAYMLAERALARKAYMLAERALARKVGGA